MVYEVTAIVLGKKFGKLTPHRLATNPTTDKGRQAFWICHCDCGEIAKVRQDRLLSGKTKSCGCMKVAHRAHMQEMAFERVLTKAISEPQTKGLKHTAPIPPKHVTAKQIAMYKKSYGLTPEQWACMLGGQRGSCAICGVHIGRTPLVVDHNHATGVVRGLLCRKCNSGLGMFNDSMRTVGAALNYLAKHLT